MSDIYGIYILDAIVIVGLMLYVKYAAPYIASIAKIKNFEFISGWVEKAVIAAEQKIQGSKMGENRKKWVIALLTSMGIIVDDAVDALIEAAVKAMNESNEAIQNAANKAIEEIMGNGFANKIGEDIISYVKTVADEVVATKVSISSKKK